jgi:hypothetical protein
VVHHVACNIWFDLRSKEFGAEQEDVAKRLLKMLVKKGEECAVHEVLRYRQVREETVI